MSPIVAFLEPRSKHGIMFLSLSPYFCVTLSCWRGQASCHEKCLTLQIFSDCSLPVSFCGSSVPIFPVTGVISEGLMKFELEYLGQGHGRRSPWIFLMISSHHMKPWATSHTQASFLAIGLVSPLPVQSCTLSPYLV